jgi:hypothetical protein
VPPSALTYSEGYSHLASLARIEAAGYRTDEGLGSALRRVLLGLTRCGQGGGSARLHPAANGGRGGPAGNGGGVAMQAKFPCSLLWLQRRFLTRTRSSRRLTSVQATPLVSALSQVHLVQAVRRVIAGTTFALVPDAAQRMANQEPSDIPVLRAQGLCRARLILNGRPST